MKVTIVRVNKTEKGKVPDFIKEVNDQADTFAMVKEWYNCDEVFVTAVGELAMEYTLRKAESTFNDYSFTIIK